MAFHMRRVPVFSSLNRMHAPGILRAFELNQIHPAALIKFNIRAASQSQSDAPDILPSQQRPGETFLDKQSRLGRPMSPWMNYQWQITNSMSIANRITGAAMGGAMAVVAIATMVGPYTFVDFMEIVRGWQIPDPVIYTLKFAAAYTFAYHFFNSLRHFAWDLGKGFDLTSTYRSGYSALIAAFVVSIGLAFFVKPEYRKPSPKNK